MQSATVSVEDMTNTVKNSADNSDYSKVKQRPFLLARSQPHTGEPAGKLFFFFPPLTISQYRQKSVPALSSIIRAKLEHEKQHVNHFSYSKDMDWTQATAATSNGKYSFYNGRKMIWNMTDLIGKHIVHVLAR